MIEERLAGGGVNEVVRVGATVRRPAGPWTPTVHRLLAHLAGQGFAGAPRAHGLDERGREVLDFVPGEVAHYPVPGHARTDAALAAAGALLRAYHDASAGFVPPPDAVWYHPPREPAEVVCHGDVATYNCVYRDGLPVAFIDFDTAHPGPRLADVAYAAYRFVPLADPERVGEDAPPVPEQARRLRLFLDAYRLDAPRRAGLPEAVAERLDALVDHMRRRAAAGDRAFARHLADGHDRVYHVDREHVVRHAARFRLL
ncbi:phosphotransferase [Sphaerisporangium rufum]|uniref:Phosphotransferase n=1 Tax=Sphaerisporangium rufum TaxID=1381558 RepID=A0A919R349_9ACTN|nr:phosphotransferase [Sphaerisporangium rufum]GII78834.1 phosphotransferase [Sphaerisporangium rufum]